MMAQDIYSPGLSQYQKCLHLFSDSEAHEELVSPIPRSKLDIALSIAHT